MITQRADSRGRPRVSSRRTFAQTVNDRCDGLIRQRSCQCSNDVYGFDISSPTMLTCVALLEYDLGMIATLPMQARIATCSADRTTRRGSCSIRRRRFARRSEGETDIE